MPVRLPHRTIPGPCEVVVMPLGLPWCWDLIRLGLEATCPAGLVAPCEECLKWLLWRG